MLFDTHCHLDVDAFNDDRDAMLTRARDAGVSLFLNPAYDLESSWRACALAQTQPDVFAAIGVHPTSTEDFGEATLTALRSMRRQPKVVAIGEIGLDYYWKNVAPAKQADAFIAQLDLAREFGLPVIIHCRDAYDDCISVLREHGQGLLLVMHSFAGTLAHLESVLALGYSIGIGGPVTYPKADLTRECVRVAPLDRILIETDAPYLPPQAWRGKRNEPAYVRAVAERIADVRQMSVDDVGRASMDNGRRLFRLDEARPKG